jgi:hypothetical protein
MPSFDHEILVDLFRECGPLALELLGRCAGIAIEHSRVEHRSVDLSQVVSTDYRADNAIVLHGRNGRAITGVIVEVQLRKTATSCEPGRSTSLRCAPGSAARQCSSSSPGSPPSPGGPARRSSSATRASG